MGSRFGGPKQLEPVGPAAETIMEYGIYDALRAGFDDVVVITRTELIKDVRAVLENRVGNRVEITYVLQRLDDVPPGVRLVADRRKPWGTGQAVLCVEHNVTTPFAVVNADDFYGRRSYALLGEFLRRRQQAAEEEGPEYAVVGFPLKETLSEQGGVNRARLDTSADMLLEHVEELKAIELREGRMHYAGLSGVAGRVPLSPEQLVSMNMWGFTPAVFEQLRRAFVKFLAVHGKDPASEFLLPSIVEDLIAFGGARVRVLPGGGPWCGMTHPQDTPRVAATIRGLVAAGEYPSPLWK